MKHNAHVAIGLLLLTFPSFLWSQSPQTSPARITITSNVHNATVFIDSVEIGTAPVLGYAVTPGDHTVCLVSHDDRSWAVNAWCEQVSIEEGKEYSLRISPLRQMRITSDPFGALVMYKDTVLGETPYIFSTREGSGSLRLSKEGYDEVTLLFDGSTTSLHGAMNPREHLRTDDVWRYLENEESQSIAPVVITASSAVLTGAAAAYWKIHADNLYDDYRLTGDPGRLHQIRKLDVASGIALGVSQISLALLTYFLLSR